MPDAIGPTLSCANVSYRAAIIARLHICYAGLVIVCEDVFNSVVYVEPMPIASTYIYYPHLYEELVTFV